MRLHDQILEDSMKWDKVEYACKSCQTPRNSMLSVGGVRSFFLRIIDACILQRHTVHMKYVRTHHV